MASFLLLRQAHIPAALATISRRVDREFSLPDSSQIRTRRFGRIRVLVEKLRYAHPAPTAMNGPNSHFELAVATEAMLFGLSFGSTLATVVGVLIEVPLMLGLVKFCLRTKGWFPETPSPQSHGRGVN